MQEIPTSLQGLDRLNCQVSLAAYEMKWQTIAQQIQQEFPGFTIAYAEIYTAGKERKTQGSMRRVLVT